MGDKSIEIVQYTRLVVTVAMIIMTCLTFMVVMGISRVGRFIQICVVEWSLKLYNIELAYLYFPLRD
jgi:hypothetical protein